MEDNFTLTWEDGTAVVQSEEVILEDEILPDDGEEFGGVCEEIVDSVCEEIVDEVELEEDRNAVDSGNVVYLTDDSILVMQSQDDQNFEEQFMEVGEGVVTEQWDEDCPEEIIIGSEEAVGMDEQAAEDFIIPLPTDQDEYTAARPYPCDFCSRRFRKKANLMNHMVAHQTDRPYGCNLCGVRYIRKCDLMNHLKIHAYIPETDVLEEEEYPLDDSDGENKLKRKPLRRRKKIKEEYDEDFNVASSSKGYNYVDEDMRLMEEMENNVKPNYVDYQTVEVRYPITDPRKPFVCQHCGVGFAREKALESHVRIHAGDSPFECQKCGEMFWDVSVMKEHIRNKHGDMEEFEDDEDEDYSEEDTKYGTFYCSTCGLSFHRQDNLKRHQRVHIKEEYINDHEFGHVCNVCGESFPEPLDLLAHAEVHARGSEHRCMICGEICNDEQDVANHVQSKHGKNLPPNTCMLCGRTCKDRRTLLKHSWEHSKEKSFACSKCAKMFHNKARLKRHMLSHRSKVVSCNICSEEFPDGRSLMNHRHSHTNLTGRQFPCRECGKTFGSRSSQQIHIRIHTGERPYGCRYCWKAFADGGTLRKHERIHTGEKPYACAVCPRAFNQRVVLREHIRSHHSGPDPKYINSVTPYCCGVCSDMFATSQDLIVHLIHHCDLNTAMRRQPQVGPRKYKRRRKLKPHELEMISIKNDDHQSIQHMQTSSIHNDEQYIELEEEKVEIIRKKPGRKSKKNSPKVNLNESYNDFYNSCSSAIENINSIVNSKTPKSKRNKIKESTSSARPKMIHTQKTRVPIETGEDGKIRHKTRTLVTHTQSSEVKPSTGERIRPRTKNVSYHILNSEKIPIATFPEDQQAINNLLKQEGGSLHGNGIYLDDDGEQPLEVASEQTIETDIVHSPTNIIKVTSDNLKPGHIINSGSKLVRLVKGGMIISKNKENSKQELENILSDMEIKREKFEIGDVDPSPLHELAEISMQHAQSMFKCEMCSAIFSDRSKLLDHVAIHI